MSEKKEPITVDMKPEESGNIKESIAIDRTVNYILIMGAAVSSLTAIGIILAVIYIAVRGLDTPDKPPHIPEVLLHWGGVILGFYFGTFASFMKDFFDVYLQK